jgi:addiction module HigA family antidote
MISKRRPMHPGEVLREEFLLPLGLSAGALAKICGVPRSRIARIASEQTDVTADTALRLSKAFGTSAEFWLNLQTAFDMRTAKGQIGDQLAKIKPVIGNAA